MPLPAEIPVRISSEAAGAISLTPVVHQTMPVRDVVEAILSTTGKDVERVRDLLLRGAVVQGASRLRWPAVHAEIADVAELLNSFPDPDPGRLFRADHCIGIRFRAGRQMFEMSQNVAAERRLFRRRSFWDTLTDLTTRTAPAYVDYSYRTRSDEYRLPISPAQLEVLRAAADLLRYSGLAAQLRNLPIDYVEFSVRFP